MKIDRKKLLEGLKVATKITPGKSTFPILACVLIDGPGQQLVATDLETTGFIPLEISDYTRTMPAEEVEEGLLEGLKGPQLKNLAEDYDITLPDGKPTVAVIRETIMAACQASAKEKTEWQEKFCIGAKDLKNILATLEEDEVEICMAAKSDDQTFWSLLESPFVRIGENFQNLSTFPVDDFPVIERVDFKDEVHVKIGREALVNVAVAVCDDNAGFNLSQVYFDLAEKAAVATDGHRLHWVALPDATDAGESFGVPNDALKIVDAKKDAMVSVKYDAEKRLVQILLENGVLQIRASESKFPDWKAVIAQPEKHVTVAKASIENSLKQALTISGNQYRSIVMRINGGLDLTFTNPEKGEYQKISIPVIEKTYGDDETVMGLNARFLLDAMKPISTENLTLGFTDKAHPMFFNHEDFSALVMPMRI